MCPKSLVKIGSVIGKIFLIWTNVARTYDAWTNVTVTVGICSRWSQEPTFQVWSKWGQLEQRYSRYGQMLPGQMLPGQMLPGQMPSWQFESVRMNIPLKFRQNKASNNWDIADIEFLWWVVVYSHFHAKPKPRLGWVEDGLGFWQNPGFIS